MSYSRGSGSVESESRCSGQRQNESRIFSPCGSRHRNYGLNDENIRKNIQVLKARSRPIKMYETEPFLCVDLLPTNKVCVSPEPTLSCDRPRARSILRSHIVPSPLTAASVTNSFNKRATPDKKVKKTEELERSDSNVHIKSPFKHSVSRGSSSPASQDQSASPSKLMKARTKMATSHINKILNKNKQQELLKTKGRLLKGRLKPMNPVVPDGPGIGRCRGVLSDATSYSPSPSRTLQRRREIVSGLNQGGITCFADRPLTEESVHQTSVASSETCGSDRVDDTPSPCMDLLEGDNSSLSVTRGDNSDVSLTGKDKSDHSVIGVDNSRVSVVREDNSDLSMTKGDNSDLSVTKGDNSDLSWTTGDDSQCQTLNSSTQGADNSQSKVNEYHTGEDNSLLEVKKGDKPVMKSVQGKDNSDIKSIKHGNISNSHVREESYEELPPLRSSKVRKDNPYHKQKHLEDHVSTFKEEYFPVYEKQSDEDERKDEDAPGESQEPEETRPISDDPQDKHYVCFSPDLERRLSENLRISEDVAKFVSQKYQNNRLRSDLYPMNDSQEIWDSMDTDAISAVSDVNQVQASPINQDKNNHNTKNKSHQSIPGTSYLGDKKSKDQPGIYSQVGPTNQDKNNHNTKNKFHQSIPVSSYHGDENSSMNQVKTATNNPDKNHKVHQSVRYLGDEKSKDESYVHSHDGRERNDPVDPHSSSNASNLSKTHPEKERPGKDFHPKVDPKKEKNYSQKPAAQQNNQEKLPIHKPASQQKNSEKKQGKLKKEVFQGRKENFKSKPLFFSKTSLEHHRVSRPEQNSKTQNKEPNYESSEIRRMERSDEDSVCVSSRPFSAITRKEITETNLTSTRPKSAGLLKTTKGSANKSVRFAEHLIETFSLRNLSWMDDEPPTVNNHRTFNIQHAESELDDLASKSSLFSSLERSKVSDKEEEDEDGKRKSKSTCKPHSDGDEDDDHKGDDDKENKGSRTLVKFKSNPSDGKQKGNAKDSFTSNNSQKVRKNNCESQIKKSDKINMTVFSNEASKAAEINKNVSNDPELSKKIFEKTTSALKLRKNKSANINLFTKTDLKGDKSSESLTMDCSSEKDVKNSQNSDLFFNRTQVKEKEICDKNKETSDHECEKIDNIDPSTNGDQILSKISFQNNDKNPKDDESYSKIPANSTGVRNEEGSSVGRHNPNSNLYKDSEMYSKIPSNSVEERNQNSDGIVSKVEHHNLNSHLYNEDQQNPNSHLVELEHKDPNSHLYKEHLNPNSHLYKDGHSFQLAVEDAEYIEEICDITSMDSPVYIVDPHFNRNIPSQDQTATKRIYTRFEHKQVRKGKRPYSAGACRKFPAQVLPKRPVSASPDRRKKMFGEYCVICKHRTTLCRCKLRQEKNSVSENIGKTQKNSPNNVRNSSGDETKNSTIIEGGSKQEKNLEMTQRNAPNTDKNSLEVETEASSGIDGRSKSPDCVMCKLEKKGCLKEFLSLSTRDDKNFKPLDVGDGFLPQFVEGATFEDDPDTSFVGGATFEALDAQLKEIQNDLQRQIEMNAPKEKRVAFVEESVKEGDEEEIELTDNESVTSSQFDAIEQPGMPDYQALLSFYRNKCSDSGSSGLELSRHITTKNKRVLLADVVASPIECLNSIFNLKSSMRRKFAEVIEDVKDEGFRSKLNSLASGCFLQLVCDFLPEVGEEGKQTKLPEMIESNEDRPDSGLEIIATRKTIYTPTGKRVEDEEEGESAAPFPPLCFTINSRPPPGSLYYFSYGTDMDPRRLAMYVRRGVETRHWGVLFGFNMLFNKRGAEGGEGIGFPNIEFNPFGSVEGCVYELDDRELYLLDSCVGYPDHYEHIVVPVWMTSGEDDQDGLARYCVPAVTYIAQDKWVENDKYLPCEFSLSQYLKGSDILTPDYVSHISKMADIRAF